MMTVVSCPGKVLLAGGYLVLDPSHQALVISTPSRFFTVVHDSPHSETTAAAAAASTLSDQKQQAFEIVVDSPQFLNGRCKYKARRDDQDADWIVDHVDQEGSTPNSFVHLSITAALLLSSSSRCHPRSLDVTIVGSNNFYSQPRSSQDPIPFAHLATTIANVHKTGLGSSAAMVTSLCAAIYLHLFRSPDSSSTQPDNVNRSPDHETLEVIHNLAQYAHSIAQGKIGSGFDVSAAVWGSQTYRRFSESCLADLLSKDVDLKPSSALLLRTLSPKLNSLWTDPATAAAVGPFTLPPRTMLILADVDAGSNTPSMVGKVLAWKKRDPTIANQTWESLRSANGRLESVLKELSRWAETDPSAYAEEVARLSTMPAEQWPQSSPFSLARSHILDTRHYMRSMGAASDVPIEPIEQTRLLNACCALDGVIGAGVPGAGGYDAIWVLVLQPFALSLDHAPSSPQSSVTQLLSDWSEMSVRPLSMDAWVEGGQGGEKGLILVEDIDDVRGLREVVASVDRS